MDNPYIIAIDFGTAYSGYAYSMTPRQAEIDPYLKVWGEEVGQKTPKTPTCILFDEHEEFFKFGYEAQFVYFKMRGDEAREKFFFECFKMSLYGKKINDDVTIQAANGKSMKALKVFTEALRYMKEDALKTIAENTSGGKFIASDFTWVLTVPAIWDPSAKQFMRKAATHAGIVIKGKEDKLVIALEPEAASVWCKKLPADGFIAENCTEDTLDQTPGTQYIVVDCGGGTIDITVHEVLDGEALKELHKVSGNDLGGQTVDRKFKDFLREIFGDVWTEYEIQYPGELQKMMYEFTVLKRNDDDIEISCPYNLGEMAKKQQAIEMFFESVQGALWDEGAIQITSDKMKYFFEESVRSISNILKEILKKDFNIEYIVLVGGYAESKILRRHITKQFGQKCKVLCPSRPQEAIVKGAVMFGRNPAVVTSRKSAYTYGFATAESFDKFKHKADKKFTADDRELCNDIFCQMVSINEDVGWDQPREHNLNPVKADQTEMNIIFYRTERKNPKYVDEWGVEQIGSFVVKMPDTTSGRKRVVKLKIQFGFTEMTATGTDVNSGSTESIELDFMTNS
ncbi:heat shock 70 kDa protein 12A-like [Archocentrus centrarchus]|uniref:heat shock 70 kDa protein 12A-like n=1 Tax=Archocentrus centrarchus TaxID=63155 RepID=UPI0011EA4A65|nr:heat shock 70 kDa protein 12A-like [Archocentrus centrarchus]